MINVSHATQAIIKPQAKSNEAAQKEIEEAMSRVKEAQSLISAAIDPVIGMLSKDKRSSRRSRSRSRGRRRRSRSRSRSRRRSRSRHRSRRSRSRSRSRRSRSRDRKRRSRSGGRRRSRFVDFIFVTFLLCFGAVQLFIYCSASTQAQLLQSNLEHSKLQMRLNLYIQSD